MYSAQRINIGQSRHGFKFSIAKEINPTTNKESTVATDFSFLVWGGITEDYLISARKLKKDQIQQIFDDALRLVTRNAGRYKQAIKTAANEQTKSHRAELQSESDSDIPDQLQGEDHGEGPSGGKQIHVIVSTNTDTSN